MSVFDATADPEQTIAPLLEQITELEQEIEHLRQQLEAANRSIDDKVDKLQAATFDRTTVAQDLVAALRKVADLEGQLARRRDSSCVTPCRSFAARR
jgi:chromosome segregation ATPase